MLGCPAALSSNGLAAAIRDVPAQRAALAEAAHRPWPLPERAWLMGQTWHHLLFAHWALPADAVARLLPDPLEPQLYDGRAWLGITPFEVSGLRLRGTLPLPWLSRFPELNVRTYVEVDGKPGIYFFSLDTSRRAAVMAARRAYRLPYFQARMRCRRGPGREVAFECARPAGDAPAASLRARYEPTGERTDDHLARWLAERYCLYVVGERGAVLRGDIHHPPWPLELAEGELSAQGMATPLGIELEGAPLLHYSERQDVVLWALAES
jgi:uncharacterized protein